jgi:uncharacterized protein DUF6916
MTLKDITLRDFSGYVGEKFHIGTDGQMPVEAELVSTEGLGFNGRNPAPEDRESFRLIFRAPKTWRSGQGIYSVTRPGLGTLDIFLVPIGPDDAGMRLEAIFNFNTNAGTLHG